MSTPQINVFNIDPIIEPILTPITRNGNPYLSAVVLLFLLAYVAYAAPTIPAYFAAFLGNPVIKFIFFFFLAYALGFSATQSLFAAIILLVIVLLINSFNPEPNNNEGFDSMESNDGLAITGTPLAVDENVNVQLEGKPVISTNGVEVLEEDIPQEILNQVVDDDTNGSMIMPLNLNNVSPMMNNTRQIPSQMAQMPQMAQKQYPFDINRGNINCPPSSYPQTVDIQFMNGNNGVSPANVYPENAYPITAYNDDLSYAPINY